MAQVFKQDLTDDSVRPGGLFFVELLMPKQCDLLVLHLRIIRFIMKIMMPIFHRP